MAAHSTSHSASSFLVIVSLAVLVIFTGSSSAKLSTNFYSKSCPKLFITVQSVVHSAISKQPLQGASLLRLHFHDCLPNVLFMICTLTVWLLLDIVKTRPIVPFRKDTHAVNPWVSTASSYRSHFKDYEVLLRLKASAEQHLRVFALEIVEGSDGGEEDVSLQLEYQRSEETSISRCQEENMLHFRGNRGGSSDRDEGEGEEEGRNGGRGDGSGRRRGGGGGGGDGGGGGGGEGGDGEEGDVEGRGGDKKKLRPTLKMLQLIAMSTIANTAQTFGSAISLKGGGLTFLSKILLILVMAASLAGYLCSIIAILLMHKRPPFSRLLVWTGCAATALGFLILIVAFILEL